MRLWPKREIWNLEHRKQGRLHAIDEGLPRKLDEATRYILIANGAALAATIGGIGSAWHYAELQAAFKVLISGFTIGFTACIFLWVFGLMATQSLFKFKDEFAQLGFTPRTWKTWFWFKFALIAWIFVLVFDALIIAATAREIGARLGVSLLHLILDLG